MVNKTSCPTRDYQLQPVSGETILWIRKYQRIKQQFTTSNKQLDRRSGLLTVCIYKDPINFEGSELFLPIKIHISWLNLSPFLNSSALHVAVPLWVLYLVSRFHYIPV